MFPVWSLISAVKQWFDKCLRSINILKAYSGWFYGRSNLDSMSGNNLCKILHQLQFNSFKSSTNSNSKHNIVHYPIGKTAGTKSSLAENN